MLQEIHDKAKGWIAYAIVAFISIPFALFGISSYLGGSDSLVAAKVNGEEILAQTVQNAVLQQRQRLLQMFGGKLPPNFGDDSLKKQALEQSVNRVLLRQLAKENGYRASNQEVYDYVSEIPAFQKEGKFDAGAYERLLVSQRRNKAGFEAEVRESISNEQFSGAIFNSAFLPKSEAVRYKQLKDQVRSIETYTLKIDDNKAGIDVSEDEIKAYYESRPGQFKTAEKAKVSYILLKETDLQKAIDVDDDKLQAYYDENQDRYVTPEQRKVAHILVKIKAAGAEAEKQAEQKAESLYEQIKSGAKTFEALASSQSDDEIAAKKAGEIGLIAMGDMGPAFEKTAFSLKASEVSKPVKTEAGYEIIKVISLTSSKQKTFDEVKTEIDKGYRQEQAQKLFNDNSDKLQTLAFENDSSLDEAADAIGAKVQTSGWISKNAAMPPTGKDQFVLENSPKVVSTAFSEEVLTSGKNSDLLELQPGIVAVIRLQDHKDAARKPLADVTEEIKTSLIGQKARKLTLEKGEALLAQVKSKGWSALDSVGASTDKLVKTPALKRTDRSLPAAIVETAFSMSKPEEGKPSYSNTLLPNGDYVLIGLNSVKNGDSKLDDVERQGFYASIGARERAAALKALRERAEVELFPENIQ